MTFCHLIRLVRSFKDIKPVCLLEGSLLLKYKSVGIEVTS